MTRALLTVLFCLTQTRTSSIRINSYMPRPAEATENAATDHLAAGLEPTQRLAEVCLFTRRRVMLLVIVYSLLTHGRSVALVFSLLAICRKQCYIAPLRFLQELRRDLSSFASKSLCFLAQSTSICGKEIPHFMYHVTLPQSACQSQPNLLRTRLQST